MQQDCILSKKELCNTDSVFVTAEKISGFHVEVIFYTTYEKKKDCLFRVDPPVAYSADSVWGRTDFGVDPPD